MSAPTIEAAIADLREFREAVRFGSAKLLNAVEELLELDAAVAREARLRGRTLTRPGVRVGGEWEQLRDALRRVV